MVIKKPLLIALTIFIGCSLTGCGKSQTSTELTLASLMPDPAGEIQTTSKEPNWTKAIETREFIFPEDHGSHDDFRIEWWYYTGNLETKTGRRFGYQLTFFRTGIQRQPENPSRWVVCDLYTMHFAISDIENKKHYSSQKNRRAGVGLAGATSGKLEVWNGPCRVEEINGTHHLQAEWENFSLELNLKPGKGVLLQGNQGLSRKGEAIGNASYYYSMPRMPTEGSVTIEGSSYEVTGNSWMDHEFSTSFLEEGQRGWDWLSLQFDDDTELMIYQMRRSDGSSDPYSSGTYVDSQGIRTELTSEDFQLTPGKAWRSPETDAEYPLYWTVKIESLGIEFQVEPTFETQEMATEATTGLAYWEGAVVVKGKKHDATIQGRGYLELTGYTDRELGSMVISK